MPGETKSIAEALDFFGNNKSEIAEQTETSKTKTSITKGHSLLNASADSLSDKAKKKKRQKKRKHSESKLSNPSCLCCTVQLRNICTFIAIKTRAEREQCLLSDRDLIASCSHFDRNLIAISSQFHREQMCSRAHVASKVREQDYKYSIGNSDRSNAKCWRSVSRWSCDCCKLWLPYTFASRTYHSSVQIFTSGA